MLSWCAAGLLAAAIFVAWNVGSDLGGPSFGVAFLVAAALVLAIWALPC